MVWFLIGLVVLLILGVLLRKANKDSIYCWLVGGMLFLVNASKNVNFTADLLNYEYYFEKYGLMSWHEMAEWARSISKDVVFYVLGKVVYILGGNFRLWIIIIALFSTILITYIIKEYSLNPTISFLMFVTLDYYYFSMSSLRQSIALAIVFYSWRMLEKGKKSFLRFIICICCAACFHKAAIIFLVVYFIYNTQIFKLWFLNIALVVIGSLGVLPTIMTQFVEFVPKQYAIYITGLAEAQKLNWSGFFIQLVLFLCCYFCYIRSGQQDVTLKRLLNILTIGVCLQVMASTVFGEMFRLSMYFSIFGLLALPRAISHVCVRERKMISIGIIMCLFGYFAMSTGDFLQMYSVAWI